MKTIFAILALLVALSSRAATPTFGSFDTNQFNVNAAANTISGNTSPDNPESLVSQIQLTAATNSQIAPAAMAFAKTNGVYDAQAISDLSGFEGELRKAGVFSNLVDAVFLKPRFNPTNALSFFGRPLLMTNLSYSQFGAQFTNATSSVTLNNLPDCRTNTIVMVYRFTNPAGFALSQTMNYAVGLGNTNNGGGFFATHIPGKYSLVFQRSTTATPFPAVQSGFTNLVQYPNLNGNYDFAHNEHATQRFVFGLSSDGQGNMSAWNNGIICALSRLGTTAFSLNDPDPVTNSLTTLRIGSDIQGGSLWGDVLAQFPGEIAAVLVFNQAATTNLIVAATVATRWLEPETMERLYVGDSRMVDGLSPIQSPTNQNPIWYFQQHRPSDVCWRNESTFNTTFALANAAFGSNLLFSIPLPGKVTEKQIYCFLGINDVYGSALTGSNIFYNGLLTFRTNAAANGWNTYMATVYPVGSNATAYTFDVTKDQQRSNFNNAVLTNAYLFSGVWHLDQFYTFNVMDTNNGYSLDGVHVTDTNGWIPSTQAANAFYGGNISQSNDTPFLSLNFFPNPPYKVFIFGDSKSLIEPAAGVSNQWPRILTNMPFWKQNMTAFTNCAVSGATIVDVTNQFFTHTNLFCPPSSGTNNILFIRVGANDFRTNSSVSWWINIYSNMLSTSQQWTNNFTFVWDIQPRTNDPDTSITTTNRDNMNAALRGLTNWDWAVPAEALVPNAFTTTLFQDGVHANTNGAVAEAAIADAARFSPRHVWPGPRSMYDRASYSGTLITVQTVASFSFNTTYFNTNSFPIMVRANYQITSTAVSGSATFAAYVNGVSAAPRGYNTAAAIPAQPAFFGDVTVFVPPYGNYAFTNSASGSGNSVTLFGGQIMFY